MSVCRESIIADGFPAIAFLLQHLTPAMAGHGFKVSRVKILLCRRIFISPAFGRFTVIVGKLCVLLGSLQAPLAKYSFARPCLLPRTSAGSSQASAEVSRPLVWNGDLEYGS